MRVSKSLSSFYLFVTLKAFGKFFILVLFLIASSSARATTALKADVLSKDTQTEFYLRLDSKPTNYKDFSLVKPSRLVLDIEGLVWGAPAVQTKGIIKRIRFGSNSPNVSRIVLDLTQEITSHEITVSPHPSLEDFWLLKAVLHHGQTVESIIENSPDRNNANNLLTKPKHLQKIEAIEKSERPKEMRPTKFKYKFTSKHIFKSPKKRGNEILVVVDAGHGGRDPGAISVTGKREKDVVLRFAKELYQKINNTYGMRAILTRDSDFYIPLMERTEIARHYNADLFISIHADSVDDKSVYGTTIYTLSENASDSIAAALAKKENLSDTIAGVNIPTQEPEIAGILLDLVRRETDGYSYEFAEHLVQSLRDKTRLMKTPHRRAGFVVLKAPDIPSVLVELGYLTSPHDETNLMDTAWRSKIISQMIFSIKKWHLDKKKHLI